jgi:hypothetical protein
VVNELTDCGNEEIGFLRAVVYIIRMCSIAHEIWMESRDTISSILKLHHGSFNFSASSLIRDSFDRLNEIGTEILVGKEGEGIRQRVHAYLEENPMRGRSVWEFEMRKMQGNLTGSRHTT